MERPATQNPDEPQEPMCINPVWWELYSTYEQRQARLAQLEHERNEKRFARLVDELDYREEEIK